MPDSAAKFVCLRRNLNPSLQHIPQDLSTAECLPVDPHDLPLQKARFHVLGKVDNIDPIEVFPVIHNAGIQFGTSRFRAQPFMRPAMNEKAQAAFDVAAAEAVKQTDRELAKLR